MRTESAHIDRVRMAAMRLVLSYPLSERTPFYRGLDKPSLQRLYDLSADDTCNSFYLKTSNHIGSHVDGPLHFNVRGRSITDYDVNELVLTRPAIADVRLEKSDLSGPNGWKRSKTYAGIAIFSFCAADSVRTGMTSVPTSTRVRGFRPTQPDTCWDCYPN